MKILKFLVIWQLILNLSDVYSSFISRRSSLLNCGVNLEGSTSRIAIGFFGMSRSLNFTYGSISRHVFDVLKNNQIAYDIFWSVSTDTSVDDSGFFVNADLQMMRPCRVTMVDQMYVRYHEFADYYQIQGLRNTGTVGRPKIPRTYRDFMKDNYESIKNILCAYYTLDILDKMIIAYAGYHDIHYDAILILRPDCAVMSDIDLPRYLEDIKNPANNNTVYIPNFQSWGGHNDRIVFGPPAAVSTWMRRLEYYKNFQKQTKLNNPETVLKYYLISHGIVVRPSTIRLLRIRKNGMIAQFDTYPEHMGGTSTALVDLKRCMGPRIPKPSDIDLPPDTEVSFYLINHTAC